jgi:hypothetical protein
VFDVPLGTFRTKTLRVRAGGSVKNPLKVPRLRTVRIGCDLARCHVVVLEIESRLGGLLSLRLGTICHGRPN